MILNKESSLISRLNIPSCIGIGLIHMIALCAVIPWCFTWSGFAVGVILTPIISMFGIGICYHRLLTHRSFKTSVWFQRVLATVGVLNLQGGPITWVRDHLQHHKYSDKEGDIHSPNDGFSWSHVLWILFKYPDNVGTRPEAKWLTKDPWIVWLNTYPWIPPVILLLVLFGTGCIYGGAQCAVSWVVWGVGVRMVYSYHVTWFVNSACHTWGYRNFPDHPDKSTNLWWVGILAWGEGWHNNHHARPGSAAHGMRWFEFDSAYLMIRLMSWVGLVWDVRKEGIPKPSTAVSTAA